MKNEKLLFGERTKAVKAQQQNVCPNLRRGGAAQGHRREKRGGMTEMTSLRQKV